VQGGKVGYFIFPALLLITAVLKVALLHRHHRETISAFWYIRPFIFPVVFSISLLLEYLNIIAVTAYVVILGLLYDMISWIYNKKMQASKS
jgi:RsiW-degrading membrane proteinase PrsW (M82 family)